MSEAVEILIKADDQASQKFAESSANMTAAMKRVESVLSDLESPADRYKQMLVDLDEMHEKGVISSEKYAQAQEAIKEKLEDASSTVRETGNATKSIVELVGTLANINGAGEVGKIASQVSNATGKFMAFREATDSGAGGVIAMRIGLVGLAATIGGAIGKALGDFIFQTKKFEREMQRARDAASELDDRLRSLRAGMMDSQKTDIELIRDPEKKKAAYEALLVKLDKDLATVTMNVNESEKAVEKWAEAWQITGERKASAVEAQELLKSDKERLATLREQRQEIQMLVSVREQERQALAAANEAKDASEKYLATLREEVQLLKASKEEQLQIEAAKNTTAEDRGEAEQLLRERDAIHAKMEAEKELEEERKRIRDEEQKAAELALQQAEQEKQRLDDLVKSEAERLELRRIELERGKEAAKVQSLINQGVDEATAKAIAAEEASLDLLQQKKQEEQDGKKVEPDKKSETGPLQASESRLLTRGEGSGPLDKLKQSFDGVKSEIAKQNALQAQSLDAQRKIAENTAKGSVLVPVA
jgi:DNA repair exonuclease SbcCD ATPase subunit